MCFITIALCFVRISGFLVGIGIHKWTDTRVHGSNILPSYVLVYSDSVIYLNAIEAFLSPKNNVSSCSKNVKVYLLLIYSLYSCF